MQSAYGSIPARSDVDGWAQTFAVLGYAGLLLVIFVTLHPFQPPVQTAISVNLIQSADSDALRQVCFVGAFAVIAMAAAASRGFAAVSAVPLTMALLLAWCIGSAAWASAPDVIFRRGTLAAIVALSTLISAGTLGYERAFRILRIVLIGVLVVNWLSLPVIPTAVHMSNELDPKLIGNWRGLYGQKNGAGAVCALTAIVFLFGIGRKRHWTDFLVGLAAIGFLVGTRSKTSMGLLPVAMAAAGIYTLAWRQSLDRAIAAILALLGIFLAGFFLLLESDTIAHLMNDPNFFTGRTEIWKADFAYLTDHLLLGAGYGTIWGTGGTSFLRDYTGSAWVLAAATSHNGYLEVLVSLGLIGLALALLALIIAPLRHFWPLAAGQGPRAGLFALFVFGLLHNLTESDFLAPDSTAWTIFLLVIASLHQGAQRHKA